MSKRLFEKCARFSEAASFSSSLKSVVCGGFPGWAVLRRGGHNARDAPALRQPHFATPSPPAASRHSASGSRLPRVGTPRRIELPLVPCPAFAGQGSKIASTLRLLGSGFRSFRGKFPAILPIFGKTRKPRGGRICQCLAKCNATRCRISQHAARCRISENGALLTSSFPYFLLSPLGILSIL